MISLDPVSLSARASAQLVKWQTAVNRLGAYDARGGHLERRNEGGVRAQARYLSIRGKRLRSLGEMPRRMDNRGPRPQQAAPHASPRVGLFLYRERVTPVCPRKGARFSGGRPSPNESADIGIIAPHRVPGDATLAGCRPGLPEHIGSANVAARTAALNGRYVCLAKHRPGHLVRADPSANELRHARLRAARPTCNQHHQ
jgi:hypothetical protein